MEYICSIYADITLSLYIATDESCLGEWFKNNSSSISKDTCLQEELC